MQARHAVTCSAVSGFLTKLEFPLILPRRVALASRTRPEKSVSPVRTLAKTRPPSLFALLQSEAGVERELHIVRAGKIPRARICITGLVVDDEEGIVD